MESKPNQFGLKTLLAIMSWSAVLVATAAWVFDQDTNSHPLDMPVLFVPPYQMLGLGFIYAPILAFVMLICSFIKVLNNPPRPLSAFYFFGCCLLILGIAYMEPRNFARWSFAMLGGSAAFTCETLLRKLPEQQFTAALLSWSAPVAAYLFALSAAVLMAA